MNFLEAAEKILREEGKPLTAKEITRTALEKKLIETRGKTPEATMDSALGREVGRDKPVFVVVSGKPRKFGLREWGEGKAELKWSIDLQESPVVKKLLETQRNSDDPTLFEKALVEAFNTLGFSAKHIGGKDEPDVLIEGYPIILDGKTTREGVITSESAIGFERLERYKESYQAKYIAVVAPGFSEGYIRETARKRGIILIETESICKILQNHIIYPYEPNRIVEILFELDKSIITPKDIPPSTFDQKKLIEIVTKILTDVKLNRKNRFSLKLLHGVYSWQGFNYESNEIESALKFLSVTPFNILQKQNDEYSLTGDIEDILKKIGLLLQAFNNIGR